MFISKIHISNFGSQGAWYQDFTFDFEVDSPTVLFSIPNHGGKTSFISFLMSCFETRVDNWIQYVRRKGDNNKMENYFDKNGRPGLLVMEWKQPKNQNDLYGNPLYQTKIIGQMVYRDNELKRKFFIYTPAQNFDFWFMAKRLKDHTEFNKRMAEVKNADSTAQICTTQEGWFESLKDLELDPEFIKVQLLFNQEEADIDGLLKNILTDMGLMRWLCKFNISEQQIENTQKMIEDLIQKQALFPETKEKYDTINQFINILKKFNNAIKIRNEKEEYLIKNACSLELLESKGEFELKLCEDRIKQINIETAQKEKEKETENRALIDVQQQINNIDYAMSFKDKEEFRIKSEKSEEKLINEKHNLELLEAAEILIEVKALKVSLEKLENQLKSNDSNIAVYENNATKSCSELMVCINKLLENEEISINNINQSIDTLKNNMAEILNKEKNCCAEIAKLEQQKEIILGNIEECKELRTYLIEFADESAEIIYETLTKRQTSLKKENEILNAENNKIKSEISENDVKREEYVKQKSGLEREIDLLDKKIAEIINETNAILREPQILDLQLSNKPDLEEIYNVINKRIKSHKEIMQQIAFDISKAYAERELINDGLLISPDISNAITALKNQGIETRLASQKLTEMSEEAAQSELSNNPVSFIGIEISENNLGKVAGLRLKNISAPVIVNSDLPQSGDFNGCVLLPENDAWWNKEAARKQIVALERQIEDLQKQKDFIDSELFNMDGIYEKVKSCLNKNNELPNLEITKQKLTDDSIELCKNIDNYDQRKKYLEEQIDYNDDKIKNNENALKKITEQIFMSSELVKKEKMGGTNELEEIVDKISNDKKIADELNKQKSDLESKISEYRDDNIIHEKRITKLNAEKENLSKGINEVQIKFIDIEIDNLQIDTLKHNWERDFNILRKSRDGILGINSEIYKLQGIFQAKKEAFDKKCLTEDIVMPFCEISEIANAIVDKKKEINIIEAEYKKINGIYQQKIGNLKSFVQNRKPEPKHIDELISLPMERLHEMFEIYTKDKIKISKYLDEIVKSFKEFQKSISDIDNQIRKIELLLSHIRNAIKELRKNTDKRIEIDNMQSGWREESEKIIKEYDKNIRNFTIAKESVNEWFSKIKAFANGKEFTTFFADIAADFNNLPLEQFENSIEYLLDNCECQITAFEGEMESAKPQFKIVAELLRELARSCWKVIKDAKRHKMPDNIKDIGGKHILKSNSPQRENADVETGNALNMLQKILKEKPKTVSALDMALELVSGLFGRNGIGFSILVKDSNVHLQYRKLSEFFSSGSQGAMAALMLYLINRKGNTTRQNHPMPLFLDNPFGKSNSPEMIDAQMKLIKEFNIQPIFFTANPHEEMKSYFNCIFELRKIGSKESDKRSYIDTNFLKIIKKPQRELENA